MKSKLFRSWLLFILAAMLFPALSVAAPGKKDPPLSANAGRQNTAALSVSGKVTVDPHTLGCILPLTGRLSDYGNRALETITLAAGFFDPQRPSPLKLLIEDSQSRPERAREAVAKLVRGGAVAIIGPLSSEEVQGATEEAQRLKIPLLTLTQKEGIVEAGDYVFRNFLTGSGQVKTLVKFAMEDLQLRRFAVLYPDDDYVQEMVKLFYQEVGRRKGSIVWAEAYKKDQVNFQELVGQMTGMTEVLCLGDGLTGQQPKRYFDFDALFVPDSYPALKKIIPQLLSEEVQDVRLLGLNGWNSEALAAAGGAYLEGAVFTDGFFSDSIYPEAIDFAAKFKAAYGRDPDVMEAEIFDTAGMAIKIIKENTGPTREKFRDTLLKIDAYPGVTGKTSFINTRDAQKETFVLTIKNGNIVQIK